MEIGEKGRVGRETRREETGKERGRKAVEGRERKRKRRGN